MPDDGRDSDEVEERKERVLHTRVPAVLEQELKRVAASFRLPVSNLVRTILEDAVDTIDSVGRVAGGELRGVADRLERRTDELRRRTERDPEEDLEAPMDTEHPGEPDRGPPLAGVVGFQPLWLAREERCLLCGRTISRGERVFLGVRETRGPRVVVGEECLPFSFHENK